MGIPLPHSRILIYYQSMPPGCTYSSTDEPLADVGGADVHLLHAFFRLKTLAKVCDVWVLVTWTSMS